MMSRRPGNLAVRLLLAAALVTCAACGATQTPAQKLARVALEQSQRFLIVKPPEGLGSAGGPRLFGLPIKLEVSVGDIATGVAALIALVAALVALRQLGTMSRQAWAEVCSRLINGGRNRRYRCRISRPTS
jgi:hypothetical protein